MAWNVLILGGGFGGLTAARRLERKLPHQSATVTLVNDANFMLYTPLLPGAAGGTLEPRHVVVPLREQLDRTVLHLGTVTGADPERKVVSVRSIGGRDQELPYDQLIVTLGSTSRTLPIPGLAEHAVGFKTLPEAIALRNRLLQFLEQAEIEPDEAVQKELLSFVFVGGGYAGLEGLAELQDLAADVIESYPRCRVAGMRFMLVEARDRVMMEIQPKLAEFASAELRRRGIEIRTETTVEEITATSATLSTGEVIPCRTVVWTAGVKPHPVVARLGLPLGAGRADRDGSVLRGPGPAGRLGDRRRGRDPRPGREGEALAADRAARAAPGQGRGGQRHPRAAGQARPGAPVPLPDARRVRRHGPPPGRGEHARDPLARLPGVVPRPDLPPRADARGRAAGAAGDGLDGRPALRARLGGARPARPPGGAGAAAAGGERVPTARERRVGAGTNVDPGWVGSGPEAAENVDSARVQPLRSTLMFRDVSTSTAKPRPAPAVDVRVRPASLPSRR